MARAFSSSLSLPSQIFPLFKPQLQPLSSPNTLFFSKTHFISTPITITNAKSKQRGSSTTITIDDDDDEEEEEEEEEEDADEEFLAFEEMRKWEMKKPVGFGEGKVYDTSVEEKLLEEMEKERLTLIAAGKKKKLESGLNKKQEQQAQKDVIPSGPCVRLGNLPKKKNIHRDLQIAFKGFNGIVDISPAVTGNHKTRDPICKGFAFVEFVSEEAAKRFVKTFSKQDILFGKVQKQISFDVINPGHSANDHLQREFIDTPIVYDTLKESAIFIHGTTATLPDSEEIEMEIKQNDNESHENELRSNDIAPSSEKQRKQTVSKKKVVKKKSAKNVKLSLPSSMARLKVKERSVLIGVFSKYGAKATNKS